MANTSGLPKETSPFFVQQNSDHVNVGPCPDGSGNSQYMGMKAEAVIRKNEVGIESPSVRQRSASESGTLATPARTTKVRKRLGRVLSLDLSNLTRMPENKQPLEQLADILGNKLHKSWGLRYLNKIITNPDRLNTLRQNAECLEFLRSDAMSPSDVVATPTDADKLRNQLHQLHEVTDENISVYIHSLCIKKHVLVEDWPARFWQQALEKGITKIIALQDFGFYPSYMPSPSSVDRELRKGDARVIQDTFKIEVVKVEPSTDLVSFIKDGGQNAQEVTLNITDLQTHQSSDVVVGQYFLWGDSLPPDKEMVKILVKKVPEKNCQIHCEGGQNRSPALVVMAMLSKRHEQNKLSRDNALEVICDVINLVRIQRDNGKCLDKNAQKGVIQFVADLLGIGAQELLDRSPSTAAPQSAPLSAATRVDRFSTPFSRGGEQCFSI